MQLKTNNICSSLKSYAQNWKDLYAKNLHKKARALLDELTEDTKLFSTKL